MADGISNFDRFNIVVFILMIITISVSGKDGCKEFLYLPCHENKTFKGHVIKTFRLANPGLEQCQTKCFNEKYCMSYNLVEVTEKILTCQLNGFDHVTYPNDVIPLQDAKYCPIQNQCLKKPCQSNFCTPDVYWDTAACHDGMWGSWCKCISKTTRYRACHNPKTNKKASDCPGQSQENSDVINDAIDARNCAHAGLHGCPTNGIYNSEIGQVLCDHKTDGGGWTVIQRRQDGSQDFFLGWQDYKVGFGDLTGEFWLGLDKIHKLTSQKRYRLRIDLEDTVFAEYDYFAVENEADKFRLRLGNYVKGNAGDGLRNHNNKQFSTKDNDNDMAVRYSCANTHKGAWWYNKCHISNLNGQYGSSKRGKGLNWATWKGYDYSAKKTEMKIRPVDYS